MTVKGLQNGTADAALMTKFDIAKLNKQFQANLVATGEPLKKAKTYFLFAKENKKLQSAVDQALTDMIKDGTLRKLSIQYLGEDYTT
ncbi:transporter substrate-binding domain-containing protein [Enterococcus bulliens]